MRIAVIGAGSVGCLYGARIARAGHDVSFLMRRDLEAVRKHGLTVHSCDGDFRMPVKAFGDPSEIGPVDLVICALKTTSLEAAERLIRPCMGPSTRLLALMNGLGVEEQFAGWCDPARVLGGLAFVCINRGEPGVIHHTDYGRVVIGHFRDDRAQAEQVAELFAAAGFQTSVAPSLRQARWEKLMWNIPFNTLGITAGGITTDRIMADDGLRELARRLMVETATAANAEGCSIDREALVQRMMANTGTMGPYAPSMLIDYRNRAPLEVESILGEPSRRAAAAGVAVPTIDVQYHLVSFLDRLNRESLPA